MPISSFSAPSAIAKPGVCTSSTRPASPYEGQVIYETDTDLLRFWDGSAWKMFGGKMPTCIIRTATVQSGIPLDTWTQATFPSTIVDVNRGGFTISGGAITIPSGAGGVYHVAGQMQWDSNSSGARGCGFASTANVSQTIVSYTGTGGFTYMRCSFAGIAVLSEGSSYCMTLIQGGSGGTRSTEPFYMPNTLSITMLSPS